MFGIGSNITVGYEEGEGFVGVEVGVEVGDLLRRCEGFAEERTVGLLVGFKTGLTEDHEGEELDGSVGCVVGTMLGLLFDTETREGLLVGMIDGSPEKLTVRIELG